MPELWSRSVAKAFGPKLLLSLVLSCVSIAHPLKAQQYVLRAGRLSKVAADSSKQAPLEWQYWLFDGRATGRTRRQVRGVISANTRDSVDGELRNVRRLRDELNTLAPVDLGSDRLDFDSVLGPIAVYDERNDYGGVVKQGVRALAKFYRQRLVLADSLRAKSANAEGLALFADFSRDLLRAYDVHYRAQERIDRGEVLRDMRLVQQLDSALNTLSRQHNDLRVRVSRLPSAGRSPP